MPDSPLAGKPAPADILIDVDELRGQYYSLHPDPNDPLQRVSFGTSGHRGTAAKAHLQRRPYSCHHAGHRRVPQGQGITGPLYMGMDSHALSAPAQHTALEVLAAHGVEVFIAQNDGFTPTPVISHAILTYNRGRKDGLADGIVITPSHNPPSDGGFKYNPPNGGPADTDITGWVQNRANELLQAETERRPAHSLRAGHESRHHAPVRLHHALCQRPGQRD